MKKKILIAAAGTAGHLHPAQALADELLESGKYEVFFVGEKLSKNPFFAKEKYPFLDVSSPKFSKNPLFLVKALMGYGKGLLQTRKLIKKENISSAVGFGSYHTFSALLACLLFKIPYILFESNAVLGKVNALFAKKAKILAYQLFPLRGKNLKKVLLPIAKEKLQLVPKAKTFYKLEEDVFTLLVFGGSQGALSVNDLFLESLGGLKEKLPKFQVIHLVGQKANLEEVEKIYQKNEIKAFVTSFENEMNRAYSAADVIICRAGANSIFEQLHFQKPAIFIPYPFLKDKHQVHNAKFVCTQFQAGALFHQKELNPINFPEKVSLFLKEDYQSCLQELKKYGSQEKEPSLFSLVEETF